MSTSATLTNSHLEDLLTSYVYEVTALMGHFICKFWDSR